MIRFEWKGTPITCDTPEEAAKLLLELNGREVLRSISAPPEQLETPVAVGTTTDYKQATATNGCDPFAAVRTERHERIAGYLRKHGPSQRSHVLSALDLPQGSSQALFSDLRYVTLSENYGGWNGRVWLQGEPVPPYTATERVPPPSPVPPPRVLLRDRVLAALEAHPEGVELGDLAKLVDSMVPQVNASLHKYENNLFFLQEATQRWFSKPPVQLPVSRETPPEPDEATELDCNEPIAGEGPGETPRLSIAKVRDLVFAELQRKPGQASGLLATKLKLPFEDVTWALDHKWFVAVDGRFEIAMYGAPKPDTKTGKVWEYLQEHGPTESYRIAAALKMTTGEVATMLSQGHGRWFIRGDQGLYEAAIIKEGSLV